MEVALSTTEAEYIALSQSMKELLPTKQLLMEVTKSLDVHLSEEATAYCKVLEDNQSCIALIKSAKMKLCQVLLVQFVHPAHPIMVWKHGFDMMTKVKPNGDDPTPQQVMGDTVELLKDFLRTAKDCVNDSITILPWHDNSEKSQ